MFFIGCSIILLPFFIVVALIKTGNYSNDGRKVGVFNLSRYSKHLVNDAESGVRTEEEDELAECVDSHWLRASWKHCVPIAPLLHVLIALCFLFPRLITEAQLIRHGFLSKGVCV